MYQDPIVKEVRKIRLEMEAECQNDPQKYYDQIQQLQQKYKERLICREPKPALKLAKGGIG